MNLGDVPTWLLVLATFSGVAAAIFAGIYAKRIYDLERKRDRSSENIEERRQASLISAWTEIQRVTVGGTSTLGVVAVAKNGSDQPIYDVEITWYRNGNVIDMNSTGLIPPGTPTPYMWKMDSNLFQNVLDPSVSKNPSIEDILALIKILRIGIAFTDAENRRWNRALDGRLFRISIPS